MSPLIGPVCVWVKFIYCTTVSFVNPGMPVEPRGPYIPERSTGDGFARTVARSAIGRRQLMKVSLPPKFRPFRPSVCPFQFGSDVAETGATE